MFGNDTSQANDATVTPAYDPGYMGSLENPATATDTAVPADLMGVPVPGSPPLADPSHGSAKDDPSSDGSDKGASVDLVEIKQKALEQLSPLVGHLEQSPEERFRTTMMMIQATDDQSLLPKAYDAANDITDEKVKAQALLDVVNEINYFTQQK